jgi:hypothetical protein
LALDRTAPFGSFTALLTLATNKALTGGFLLIAHCSIVFETVVLAAGNKKPRHCKEAGFLLDGHQVRQG